MTGDKKRKAETERAKFTDAWLRSLEPEPKGTFKITYDTTKPGLAVRVTDQPDKVRKGKAGSITFIFVGRFPGAKTGTKRTIGRFGKITLAKAYEILEGWQTEIVKGVDPKIAAKEAAELAAQEAAEKRERSFENVLSEFITARKRDGVKKWREDETDFNRECLPGWKGRAVDDISMGDILTVLESIDKRGKTRQALNMGQKIGTFFNYCVDVELLDASPYRPKRVAKVIGTKEVRERVLTPVEVRAFWKATDTLRPVVRDAYRTLILTGSRLNEVCKLAWSEIDFDRERITLEKSRTKQGRDHVIPMTTMVREILDARKHDRRPWVFLSELDNVLVIHNKDKKALDAAMLAELRKDDPEAKLAPFVNHDIRRTVQTGMGDEGVTDDIIHAVVGHKTDRLTQTYNKSERMPEKRAALETWERKLREIIGLPPLKTGEVIQLYA